MNGMRSECPKAGIHSVLGNEVSSALMDRYHDRGSTVDWAILFNSRHSVFGHRPVGCRHARSVQEREPKDNIHCDRSNALSNHSCRARLMVFDSSVSSLKGQLSLLARPQTETIDDSSSLFPAENSKHGCPPGRTTLVHESGIPCGRLCLE
jgi:hypothetical protein